VQKLNSNSLYRILLLAYQNSCSSDLVVLLLFHLSSECILFIWAGSLCIKYVYLCSVLTAWLNFCSFGQLLLCLPNGKGHSALLHVFVWHAVPREMFQLCEESLSCCCRLHMHNVVQNLVLL